MQEKINAVEQGSVQVNEMVASIINNQTAEIDNYIDGVRTLMNTTPDVPDADLDKMLLQIPTCIYHLTTVLQDIDVRKGVAAENAKYYENEMLLQTTGTVAEKQAKATNATIKDRVVQLAYKSAASLVQSKMNAAMEILASAKRVQQRRLEEMKLTKLAGNAAAI